MVRNPSMWMSLAPALDTDMAMAWAVQDPTWDQDLAWAQDLKWVQDLEWVQDPQWNLWLSQMLK